MTHVLLVLGTIVVAWFLPTEAEIGRYSLGRIGAQDVLTQPVV